MKFWRNADIEALAESRLAEFEQMVGRPITSPVPIDLVAEKVLGLSLLWDTIEELPGEVILGAIVPKKRLIILNEGHRDFFAKKPGVERSTKGHEMGHWDLYVDKGTLDHPCLLDLPEDGPFALRSTGAGDAAVLKILHSCPEGQELLKQMEARADEPVEARAVNRYAAVLSMPKRLIREEALKIDRTRWKNLYRLAERFDVTISALVVRLQQIDLLYLGPNKILFESRDVAH